MTKAITYQYIIITRIFNHHIHRKHTEKKHQKLNWNSEKCMHKTILECKKMLSLKVQ